MERKSSTKDTKQKLKIKTKKKIQHRNNRILTRNIIYSHLSHKFIFNFAQFTFTTRSANNIAQPRQAPHLNTL